MEEIIAFDRKMKEPVEKGENDSDLRRNLKNKGAYWCLILFHLLLNSRIVYSSAFHFF